MFITADLSASSAVVRSVHASCAAAERRAAKDGSSWVSVAAVPGRAIRPVVGETLTRMGSREVVPRIR